jgi:hypothetical protein
MELSCWLHVSVLACLLVSVRFEQMQACGTSGLPGLFNGAFSRFLTVNLVSSSSNVMYDKQVEKLIDLVRQREPLYNKRHRDYKNQLYANNAWKSISAEHGHFDGD